MSGSAARSDLFFLIQRKGNGAMLFSIQETSRGPELAKIGTFDNQDEPRLIAAALNAALQGEEDALSTVDRSRASLSAPLRKAIDDRATGLEKTHRGVGESFHDTPKATRALTENMGRPNTAMLSLFSTTACGHCPDCGCDVDGDCIKCSVCGPDRRNCENCRTVRMTPRTAFVLHYLLRSLADRTYLTVQNSLWEYGVPDSVETQTDWFLLHCARAYDDLAADLLVGQIPEPRCLAESVVLGHALSSISQLDAESIRADEAYQALPASRLDADWELLTDGGEAFDVGDRARAFLASEVIEEDLWDEWFTPYPGVERRDKTRGFRC
jgi:Oxygen-sensitive ribonucleoside-triphosphate reductase